MPVSPTSDEQAELEARRRQAKEEADQKQLTDLKQRAMDWAWKKSTALGDEGVRLKEANHGGDNENSKLRMSKSFIYHQFAQALNKNDEWLEDRLIQSDPEIAQFQTVAAACVKAGRTTTIEKFAG